MSVLGIVLNYNGEKVISETLRSLAGQEGVPLDVWVVDNKSTDASAAMVLRDHPDIRLIQTGANLGWAGAYNAALKQARQTTAEWFWFLNNDIIAESGCLQALLKYGEINPAIKIFSPWISCATPPGQCWFCGGYVDSQSFDIGHCVDIKQFRSLPQESRYISGCAMLVHRSVIDKIGGFDARFFMYCEDADFCRRATRAGFACDVVPESRLIHMVRHASGGSEVLTPFLVYHTLRSVMMFWKKHAGWRRYHHTFCRHHLGKWLNKIPEWRNAAGQLPLADAVIDAAWYHMLPGRNPLSWPIAPAWFKGAVIKRPWLVADWLGWGRGP